MPAPPRPVVTPPMPALPPMHCRQPPNSRPAAKQAANARSAANPLPSDSTAKASCHAKQALQARRHKNAYPPQISLLKGLFEFQLFRDLWRGGRVDKIFPRLYLLLRWCFSKSPYAIEGCTVHAVRQRQTAARSLRVGAIACVMKSYSGVSYPCKPK